MRKSLFYQQKGNSCVRYIQLVEIILACYFCIYPVLPYTFVNFHHSISCDVCNFKICQINTLLCVFEVSFPLFSHFFLFCTSHLSFDRIIVLFLSQFLQVVVRYDLKDEHEKSYCLRVSSDEYHISNHSKTTYVIM